MSDTGFERVIYNIARSESSLRDFLVEKGILRSPDSIGRCPNCRLRGKLVWSTRERNLTPATSHKKEKEGECPARLLCIRCTKCKTRISTRSGTFFSYLDSNNRANSKVSLASIILIILKWSTKCRVSVLLRVCAFQQVSINAVLVSLHLFLFKLSLTPSERKTWG